MSDLASRLSSKDLIVLVMLSGFFITAIVWTGVAVMHMWQVNRRESALIELKHELASRGMSAEQIVAVLEAGHRESSSSASCSAASVVV